MKLALAALLCTATTAGTTAGAAGCTASSSQVAPPQYDPYFPADVAVSPDGAFLFVLNANSDLRYDSGTMQVLDLDAIDAVAASWTPGTPGTPGGAADPSCTGTRDGLTPDTFVCCSSTGNGGTPADFVVGPATVKIGNFASSIGIQELDATHYRLFSPVRGDPSLTWIDFDSGLARLSCDDTGAEFARCDERHRLDDIRGDRATFGGFSEEPFGVYVDSGAERVFITHLTSGRVSLASSPRDADPRLEDVLSGLWAPNRRNGLVGAVGVAARVPGDRGGFVYVTSSQEARISMIRAADATGGAEQLVRGPSFMYSAAFEGQAIDGAPGDARAITFTDDGDRAFVVSRVPTSLMAFDTSIDTTGVPRNDFLGSVEICTQPARLAIADLGDGLRGYVPCFGTGQVWVVDLERLELVDVIEVGSGPAGVAVSAARGKVYVANYADDTVAVIDVQPGSPTENHTVLRLGMPRDRGANCE